MEANSPTSPSTEETIVVRGLRKNYGKIEALKGISFRIRAGEIVGFLGPNGAGKTTTMKILTGYMAATDGEATVAGFDIRRESEAARQRIGYLPENVPLYEDMLVYDYLQFVASVQDVARKGRDERVLEVAGLTGIKGVLGKTIHELSKGYRQRVGLAQAIIHEPEVIILDEPTTGLDPNQIVDIRDVITTIGREKTIIFSTHILQEVTAVCDRIIIIDQGRLVADGTLQELEQEMMHATPGIVVAFDSDDAAGLRAELEGLSGVARVVEISRRTQEVAFRLEGDDEAQIRRSVIDAEAASPRKLKRLQNAQPTLEDIFRRHTAKGASSGTGEAETEPTVAAGTGALSLKTSRDEQTSRDDEEALV